MDISFKKDLVKGWLPNEINKRAKPDAEISDNRNGPQEGYDQAGADAEKINGSGPGK